ELALLADGREGLRVCLGRSRDGVGLRHQHKLLAAGDWSALASHYQRGERECESDANRTHAPISSVKLGGTVVRREKTAARKRPKGEETVTEVSRTWTSIFRQTLQ